MKEDWDLGKKSAIVLCGGNIDLNVISKIIERGLAKNGRVSRLELVISDMPGSLHKITSIVAKQKANIIQIHHDRLTTRISMGQTRVELFLECKGQDHVEEVCEALKSAGAKIL